MIFMTNYFFRNLRLTPAWFLCLCQLLSMFWHCPQKLLTSNLSIRQVGVSVSKSDLLETIKTCQKNRSQSVSHWRGGINALLMIRGGQSDSLETTGRQQEGKPHLLHTGEVCTVSQNTSNSKADEWKLNVRLQTMSLSIPSKHHATKHRTLQGSTRLSLVLTRSLSSSLDSNDLHIEQMYISIFTWGLAFDKSAAKTTNIEHYMWWGTGGKIVNAPSPIEQLYK